MVFRATQNRGLPAAMLAKPGFPQVHVLYPALWLQCFPHCLKPLPPPQLSCARLCGAGWLGTQPPGNTCTCWLNNPAAQCKSENVLAFSAALSRLIRSVQLATQNHEQEQVMFESLLFSWIDVDPPGQKWLGLWRAAGWARRITTLVSLRSQPSDQIRWN